MAGILCYILKEMQVLSQHPTDCWVILIVVKKSWWHLMQALMEWTTQKSPFLITYSAPQYFQLPKERSSWLPVCRWFAPNQRILNRGKPCSLTWLLSKVMRLLFFPTFIHLPAKNLFTKKVIGYFMEVFFPKNIHFRPKYFHDVLMLFLIQLLKQFKSWMNVLQGMMH